MKKYKIKAFTLVELIIVITILAILATIGFMSFQSYTLGARDGKRITDLKEIRNGLEIYRSKNSLLPNPDIKYVTIEKSVGNILSLQGYVGNTVLQELKGNSDFKDPLNKENYTYIVNSEKTKYQLLSYLEENNSILSFKFFNKTYSSSSSEYLDRFPYLIGDQLGGFTDDEKNPIQLVYTGTLNLSSHTGGLIIYKNNTDEPVAGTGGNILESLGEEPSAGSGCIFDTSKFDSCTL